MDTGADPHDQTAADFEQAQQPASLNGYGGADTGGGTDVLVAVGIAFVAGFLLGGLVGRVAS